MNVIPRDTPPEAAPEVWFEVYGKRYEFPTSLTFGEAKKFKELAGVTLEEVEGNLTTQGLAAMVYIALKRVDPSVTEADIDSLVIEQTLKSSDEVAESPLAPPTLVAASGESSTGSGSSPEVSSPETAPTVSGAHG